VSTPDFTAPAPAGSRPVEYASFARRLGAALLDSLVWIIGLLFFNPAAYIGNETAAAVVVLILLSVWFNYFAICEWRWGQTIGKNMTGIRVVPLEGGRLSWGAAALRNLLRLVDLPLALIGADYLIVHGSPRRQRLGDRAANTIVVRERGQGEAPEPAATSAAVSGPSAAELFGDAAEALGRHPAAGSQPPPEAPPEVPEAPEAPEAVEVEPEPAVPGTAKPSPFADVTWTPGVALGGVLAALLAAIILAIPVVAIDPNVGTDEGSTAGNIVTQLIQAVTLIAVPLAIAAQRGDRRIILDPLRRLGVRRFRPSAFGWMAVAVVAYLVIAAIAYTLLSPEQENIAQEFGALPFQVLLIAVAAPISEELCFRGFLFGGLRARMPAVLAALASGLFFGALHAPTGLETVPQLVIFGAVLALLYDKTGSILPGLILHVINNSVALLAS
jgi:CAAX protease family protein